MQDQTLNELILLPVPAQMLEEAGIGAFSLVQYSVSDGKITIEVLDDTADFVCDGDCENCPCSEECDESEAD